MVRSEPVRPEPAQFRGCLALLNCSCLAQLPASQSRMKYRSTRGGVSGISFTDALLMGLADDGGLLIPDHIPDVSSSLEDWRNLNFVQVAQRLLKLFIDDVEHDDLDALTAEAFAL